MKLDEVRSAQVVGALASHIATQNQKHADYTFNMHRQGDISILTYPEES